MKGKTVVAVGVLAALALGGLAAAAGTVGSAEPAAVPSVIVPVGRLGDEVNYLTSWTVEQTGWPDKTSRGLYNASGQYESGVRLAQLTTALDNTLLPHDVVEVEFSSRQTPVLSQTKYWANPGRLFVDLETRSPIQTQHIGPGELRYGIPYVDPGISHVFNGTGAFYQSLYQPVVFGRFDYFYQGQFTIWADTDEGLSVLFEFQDRTLTLGQDLTPAESPWLGPALDYWYETDSSHVQAVSYESRVSERGILNGEEVFGVERNLTVDRQQPAASNYGRYERKAVTWRETLWTKAWVGANSPYPLRVEASVVSEGHAADGTIYTGALRLTKQQSRYATGLEPVPWGAGVAPDHYRNVNPDAERTKGRFPGDGAGSRLPYAIAKAVATVKQDPTLVEFGAWKQRHPENYLVGASLSADVVDQSYDWLLPPRETTIYRWVLVFAEPGGPAKVDRAFIVETSKEATTGAVLSRDLGKATLDGEFHVDDLPTDPVTWAALDAIWRTIRPPEATVEAPNYAWWGYYYWLSDDPRWDNYVRAAPSDFQYALLGRERPTQLRAQGDPPRIVTPAIDDGLWVNVSAGTVYSAFWGEGGVGYQPTRGARVPFSPVTDREPSHAMSAASEAAVILPAILISASLLAVLLVAYFYPILKFVGTQALAIVPGYAKLKKSQLTDNAYRDQLMQSIREEPGTRPPSSTDG